MTISTTYAPIQYNGNGVTIDFAVPFVFFDQTDLVVTLTAISTGDDDVQTITTDYTVSGGNGSSGEVSFLVAPASGYRVTIAMSVPYLQTDNYVEGQAFPAEVIEEGFDRAALRDQQLADSLDRSLKFPATITGITAGILPQPVAGSILVWDGTTGAIGNVDIADLSTSINTVLTGLASGDILQWDGSNWVNTQLGISAFGATLVDDADAAAARATLGLGTAATTAATDYATAAQGALAATALQPGDATKQVGGTVVTTTSGTTANIGSLPAGIKRIHIGIAGVSTNGTSGIELALGTSGGITTSGYLGSVVKNITGVATSLHPSDAFNLVETTWAAAGVLQGVITLILVDAATNTWTVGGTLSRSDSATTFTLSGSVALPGAITQLQLQTTNATDTFDAGKFNIVYE